MNECTFTYSQPFLFSRLLSVFTFSCSCNSVVDSNVVDVKWLETLQHSVFDKQTDEWSLRKYQIQKLTFYKILVCISLDAYMNSKLD